MNATTDRRRTTVTTETPEAVRGVLALHTRNWSCGDPGHTNPNVGCPVCDDYCAECGQSWPCRTYTALAAHLDLTDSEGDPT